MTRAEAIEYLIEVGSMFVPHYIPVRGIKTGANKVVDVFRMAIAALREQEQREQGCEWCYNFQKDPHFYVGEGNGQYTDVVFKFCPMCGRRLEDNHD